MASITLDHVDKAYSNGYHAIRDVNLRIKDKEFVILVGPSGCGKSTLLNMIAGLEEITGGSIYFGDQKVNDLTARQRDVAMVFQSYALYPHMSVRENIAFPLKLSHLPKEEIKQKIAEVAASLGIEEYLDRKPAQLSGGQRQRVAMARAIVRRPRVFLMDEPLSNLDAKLRVQMRSEIAKLQQRLGVTTVYVTHDQTEAMTLGDRVVVLKSGVIQQVGAPDDLYRSPENIFVASFIGSPAMNFFSGRLSDDASTVTTPLGAISLPNNLIAAAQDAQSSSVVLGVRPEHFDDAFLLTEEERAAGHSLEVELTIVESTGAERFAYFRAPESASSGSPAPSEPPAVPDFASAKPPTMHGASAPSTVPDASALAANDIPTGEDWMARLDSTTVIKPGLTMNLWVASQHLYLFDGVDGKALR